MVTFCAWIVHFSFIFEQYCIKSLYRDLLPILLQEVIVAFAFGNHESSCHKHLCAVDPKFWSSG